MPSMALEELSFEGVYGRTEGQSDGRTDDGQNVITLAHPEHSSGELKYDMFFRLNDIILLKFPLYFSENGKIKMSLKTYFFFSFPFYFYCFDFFSAKYWKRNVPSGIP